MSRLQWTSKVLCCGNRNKVCDSFMPYLSHFVAIGESSVSLHSFCWNPHDRRSVFVLDRLGAVSKMHFEEPRAFSWAPGGSLTWYKNDFRAKSSPSNPNSTLDISPLSSSSSILSASLGKQPVDLSVASSTTCCPLASIVLKASIDASMIEKAIKGYSMIASKNLKLFEPTRLSDDESRMLQNSNREVWTLLSEFPAKNQMIFRGLKAILAMSTPYCLQLTAESPQMTLKEAQSTAILSGISQLLPPASTQNSDISSPNAQPHEILEDSGQRGRDFDKTALNRHTISGSSSAAMTFAAALNPSRAYSTLPFSSSSNSPSNDIPHVSQTISRPVLPTDYLNSANAARSNSLNALASTYGDAKPQNHNNYSNYFQFKSATAPTSSSASLLPSKTTHTAAGSSSRANRPKSAFFSPDSKVRSPRRLAALRVCGWGHAEDEQKMFLLILQENQEFSRAAAYSLLHGDHQLCVKILASSNNERLRLVSSSLAGYFSRGPEGSHLESEDYRTWILTCATLSRQFDDPYLCAIFAFLASSERNFDLLLSGMENETFLTAKVLNANPLLSRPVKLLPLKDRLGVALRFLSDSEVLTFGGVDLSQCWCSCTGSSRRRLTLL